KDRRQSAGSLQRRDEQRQAGRRSEVQARRRSHLPGAGRSEPQARTESLDPLDSRSGARQEGSPDGRTPRRRVARRLQEGRRRNDQAREHAQDGRSQQGLRSLRVVNQSDNSIAEKRAYVARFFLYPVVDCQLAVGLKSLSCKDCTSDSWEE